MGEIGVHLDDRVGPVLQGVPEAGDVRAAETELARSMEDMECGYLAGELFGDLARAIGRVVIDDQNMRLGWVVFGVLAVAGHGHAQIASDVFSRERERARPHATAGRDRRPPPYLGWRRGRREVQFAECI